MLDSPPWAPTIAQVASRIMARTRTENGSPAGTFNNETFPTAEQVTTVINQAVSLMRPRLGPVADSMVDQAQALAALRSAYMIELAYFPEQTETAVSPFNALVKEFGMELANWDEAAKGLEPNSSSSITSVKVRTEYPGYATTTY
jgi:hypothetical protein